MNHFPPIGTSLQPVPIRLDHHRLIRRKMEIGSDDGRVPVRLRVVQKGAIKTYVPQTEPHHLGGKVEEQGQACYQQKFKEIVPAALEKGSMNKSTSPFVTEDCVLKRAEEIVDNTENVGHSAYGDPVFSDLRIVTDLLLDMVKLENQIPLFVIAKLAKVIYTSDHDPVGRLKAQILNLFNSEWLTGIPITKTEFKELKSSVHQEKCHLHILNVFRQSLLYDKRQQDDIYKIQEIMEFEKWLASFGQIKKSTSQNVNLYLQQKFKDLSSEEIVVFGNYFILHDGYWNNYITSNQNYGHMPNASGWSGRVYETLVPAVVASPELEKGLVNEPNSPFVNEDCVLKRGQLICPVVDEHAHYGGGGMVRAQESGDNSTENVGHSAANASTSSQQGQSGDDDQEKDMAAHEVSEGGGSSAVEPPGNETRTSKNQNKLRRLYSWLKQKLKPSCLSH